jgi:hypothetical protein
MATFDFNTRKFEGSYGRKPRGWGVWAFEVEGFELFTPHSMIYTEAKKWVKNEVTKMAGESTGYFTITVLP